MDAQDIGITGKVSNETNTIRDHGVEPHSRFLSEERLVPKSCLAQRFRCPQVFDQFRVLESPTSTSGYFRFGSEAICYGSFHKQAQNCDQIGSLHDALPEVLLQNGIVSLPFDPEQLIQNFEREAYVDEWRNGSLSGLANLYYLVRPALPVPVRRHLQKWHLRGWTNQCFPRWPVDCSVDHLLCELLTLSLRTSGAPRIPFIWFWPEGKSSCAVMTHDVETRVGLNYCRKLMDVDDSFGFKASFQIIPEGRYTSSPAFLDEIRRRGFEICVHDLNHDGHLYKSREQFLQRAARINTYGKELRANGFRAGALYRKQVWYDALRFSFDMSVPNVAHLDPQHGGCCTVMPYFIGDILEIPVTTIQDYTLFNILNDYSINIWKQQTAMILQNHGLMSFIIHPDYIIGTKELDVVKQLLDHLAQLREQYDIWAATPGEVDKWWRQRAEMYLVEDADGWKIEGVGSERARVAYASLENDQLVMSV